MNQVVQTREFVALIRQELDLEQLIRKVLQYLLDKAGPTNAALFLPTGDAEFALGGYVNYDVSGGSTETVLQHLADVVAPRIAASETLIHVKDNAALKEWLGDDAAYLADSEVVAFACRHNAESMAVLVLFRDAAQGFDPSMVETCRAIAPTLGNYLARVVRIHHRHLPFEEAA
jgi:hypothetical protein